MEQQEAMPYSNLRDHLEQRAGDKEFMLKVLAHINQEHYLFATDYRPPKKKTEQPFNFEFNNNDNFFDGLPDCKGKGKHSQALNLLIPKDQRKEYELKKAQWRITQLEAKTKKLQEEMKKESEKAMRLKEAKANKKN